jgi:hypothetical protein
LVAASTKDNEGIKGIDYLFASKWYLAKYGIHLSWLQTHPVLEF